MMKHEFSIEQQEDEDLRCPICNYYFSTITKPYLLQCNHNLCNKCIDSIINKKMYNCPICRKSFTDEDRKSFQVNFAFLNLVIKILKTKVIYCKKCQKIFNWVDHHSECEEKEFKETNEIMDEVKKLWEDCLQILKYIDVHRNILNKSKTSIYENTNEMIKILNLKFYDHFQKTIEQFYQNIPNLNVEVLLRDLVTFLEMSGGMVGNNFNFNNFLNELEISESSNNNNNTPYFDDTMIGYKRNYMKTNAGNYSTNFVKINQNNFTNQSHSNNFTPANHKNKFNNNYIDNFNLNNNFEKENYFTKSESKSSTRKINFKHKIRNSHDNYNNDNNMNDNNLLNRTADSVNNINNFNIKNYLVKQNSNKSINKEEKILKSKLNRFYAYNTNNTINNNNIEETENDLEHLENENEIIDLNLESGNSENEHNINNYNNIYLNNRENKSIKSDNINSQTENNSKIKKINLHNNKKNNIKKINSSGNTNILNFNYNFNINELLDDNLNFSICSFSERESVKKNNKQKIVVRNDEIKFVNVANKKLQNKNNIENIENLIDKKENVKNIIEIDMIPENLNNINNTIISTNPQHDPINKILLHFNKTKDTVHKILNYSQQIEFTTETIKNQISTNYNNLNENILNKLTSICDNITTNFKNTYKRYLINIIDNTKKIWIFDTKVMRSETKEFTNLNYKLNNTMSIEFDDNDLIFISGGKFSNSIFDSDSNFSGVFLILKWSNKLIELKGNLPHKRAFHNSIYLDNKLYVVGGVANLINSQNLVNIKDCEGYNIVDKRWELMPMLNCGRCCPSLCVYNNNYLYAFRGYSFNSKEEICYLDTIEFINIKNISGLSTWTLVKPEDPGMTWMGCSSSVAIVMEENKILICGGNSGSDKNCRINNYTYIYDPLKKTVFRSKDLIKSACFNINGTIQDNSVIIIDQKNETSKPFGIHIFDLENKIWKFNQI